MAQGSIRKCQSPSTLPISHPNLRPKPSTLSAQFREGIKPGQGVYSNGDRLAPVTQTRVRGVSMSVLVAPVR